MQHYSKKEAGIQGALFNSAKGPRADLGYLLCFDFMCEYCCNTQHVHVNDITSYLGTDDSSRDEFAVGNTYVDTW